MDRIYFLNEREKTFCKTADKKLEKANAITIVTSFSRLVDQWHGILIGEKWDLFFEYGLFDIRIKVLSDKGLVLFAYAAGV